MHLNSNNKQQKHLFRPSHCTHSMNTNCFLKGKCKYVCELRWLVLGNEGLYNSECVCAYVIWPAGSHPAALQ